MIAVQLSRKHPDEGGIYSWTVRALGQKAGFMVAWLYWVNTIFYYPTVLIFCYYITVVILVAFWLVATVISFCGLKANKYLVDIGSVLGSFLPAIVIIVLGFIAYFC